ncbi:alpha/beta fold hydrolase [Pelagerythrobacter rhizovicinus]|uniref:Alpha/beta hydrolase n=1 Tax=Pelagerythrobacter rhizovicinus TaxID=2268576 RepID=A0A4Q2KQU9_9SPHN|nr:alpha/beta hydrolase [Pelagerythrobacter rhizovicinus]RXZ66012.1 alpha/beta hydrolase [Pelagerythrobacter rhizovicinus]
MDTEFSDRFWESPDGLKLHFRDYPGREDHVPVVCMHGLTRNARDFATLAEHLAGEHRVLVPEMRGRGDSEYARDPATYTPMTYVEDVSALLAQEGISRFVAVGTSLGGLMTMMLAAAEPGRIAGAVLNDVGPELQAAGLARIAEYVGQGRNFPTWMHAARALEEVHSAAHPGFDTEGWIAMAKRTMTVQQNGRIAFDYDMSIAEPFQAGDGAAPPDLWPAYDALQGAPLLIVRGALSDLLSEETARNMVTRHPDAELVTVADTGHAPLLDEPAVLAAIDRLMAKAA